MLKRLLGFGSTETGNQLEVVQQLPEKAGDRIIVFGSNLAGAEGLSGALRDFLGQVGISGVNVHKVRLVQAIEDAFHGEPGATSETPNLPMGVIVLPEMRQKVGEHSRMSIPTPVDYIGELCAKNGVPMVEFGSDQPGQEAIAAEQLAGLIAKSQLAIEQ